MRWCRHADQGYVGALLIDTVHVFALSCRLLFSNNIARHQLDCMITPTEPPTTGSTLDCGSVYLVNASTGKRIHEIETGVTPKFCAQEWDFTLEVDISGCSMAADEASVTNKVKMSLTGTTEHEQSETKKPYYLFGDYGDLVYGQKMMSGAFKLEGTADQQNWSNGGEITEIAKFGVDFEVVECECEIPLFSK